MNAFKTLFVVVVALALGASSQVARAQLGAGGSGPSSHQPQTNAPTGPFCLSAPCLDVFTVDYFANANTLGAPDATVRIINPGTESANSDTSTTEAADHCALIYVFDANQEMSECCACTVTANQELTVSVNNNLTANPLLGAKLHTGVIEIFSTELPAGGKACDPRGRRANVIEPFAATLRAWATHIQNRVGTAYPITEGESQAAALGEGELNDLPEDCIVLMELGSGAGTCTCPPGH
jgi:hypothetical protein